MLVKAMKNIDYLYRENEGLIIQNDNHNINITELLKKDYPYIFESLNNSKYTIRLNECDLFKELTFNHKVVGFVTYNNLNKSNKLLTNVYIIEGYRRNGIFMEELKKQYEQSHRINIYEPNKLMIEVLKQLRYAKQITNNLVISAINFNMQLSSSLSNSTNKQSEKLKITNMYDTNICATISFKIFNKTKYTVYYTPIQEEDRNKCENARNNMEKNYFDSIVSTIIEQDKEIQRWQFLLQHYLPKKQINLEEIIGTNDSPSQLLKDSLENNQITPKEAKNIQNQLRLEFRTKKVDEESIHLRLNYLINNTNSKITNKINDEDYCPYCYEEKPSLENYCTNCGYKFFDLDEISDEEFVYKYLLKEKQSYKYSLTGKKELKFFSNEEYLIKQAILKVLKEVYEYSVGKEVFMGVSRELNINYLNLEKIMLEEGYVTYDMNSIKWDNEAYTYTNKELKAFLKENNCKVSGTKYELIQRIKNEIPLEKIKSDILSLTGKGKDYFNENRYLLYFETFPNYFIIEEYEEFRKQNYNKEESEILISFLQKHIDTAIENKNHDHLVEALITQSQIYTFVGDLRKFLENEVRIVILNLNMCYIDSHYYSYYKPVEKLSWDVLYDFRNHFTNEEVNEVIYEVYNSFEKKQLKVEFYDMVDVFKDIFRHYSLSGINGRIQRKYYKKSYNRIKDVKKTKKDKISTLDRFFLN